MSEVRIAGDVRAGEIAEARRPRDAPNLCRPKSRRLAEFIGGMMNFLPAR